MSRGLTILCLLALFGMIARAEDQPKLAASIPLPNVESRIDHFAFDGHRLFVAALGNNTVEVVDVASLRARRGTADLRPPEVGAAARRSPTRFGRL